MAVWNLKSSTDITLRMTLKGHEDYVWAVDLNETTIISGSADKTIKVQSHVLNYVQQGKQQCILVHNLTDSKHVR